MKPHKNLKAWQKSMELVKMIYKFTRKLPSEEKYGLAQQMRRAAVSVPSNIAEGAARQGNKESAQFYSIARASLSELDTQNEICKDIGYFSQIDFSLLATLMETVDSLLNGLIKNMRNKLLLFTFSPFHLFTFLRFIGLSFLFHLFTSLPLYAQAMSGKSGIEAKVALESSLENRLKKVLTEIAGTEDLIVIVNVELAKEQAKTETKKRDEEFILPGVPIREAISEKNVQSAVMSALGEDTRTLIRKIKATIIVDTSIAADTENIIKEVASGLLGIDEIRGDQLIIQKMRFRKQIFTFASLFYPPNIFYLVGIAAGVLMVVVISMFLLGTGKDFAKNFVLAIQQQAAAIKESRSGGEQEIRETTETRELEKAIEVMPGLAASPDASLKQRPFSFVTENNLRALLYLLKNTPSSAIAVIISYLDPELSAKIISQLPEEKRKEIALYLSETKELSAEDVEKIENHIKLKIDFVVGGEEKLTTLLEGVGDSMKNVMIEALAQKSPSIAQNIAKSIVTVDILERVDATVLQLIIRQFGGGMFAQILRSFPADKQEKILSVMPSGAASRIKQEIELTKPVSAARLEIEKKRLVGIIKRMQSRGLI